MSQSCGGGGCGGTRRHFLRTTAATGAALATADAFGAAQQVGTLPTTILGKTGAKVPRLGMGTSWTVQPSFVQSALLSGVTFIDTSESYENGNSEITLGEVLERTGKRKDVFLVSKCAGYRNQGDPGVFRERLTKSLERLKTDYVDAYYLHGIKGEQTGLLFDDGVKKAFADLKKEGKLKFAGFSCHDAKLVECVEAAAKCGWIDQIMIQYNYRTMGADALKRAVDLASKANIGLVAMKTQGGAEPVAPDDAKKDGRLGDFLAKGFNPAQAAIKAVFADERFQVVVSEMTNREQLRENRAAAMNPLTPKEAKLLDEHRTRTANLYCHGCGHLCETAAKGVPVSTVLRYLRYYSVYGKRAEARALYQALPPAARGLAEADLAAAERACPHGLPVVALIGMADRRLS